MVRDFIVSFRLSQPLKTFSSLIVTVPIFDSTRQASHPARRTSSTSVSTVLKSVKGDLRTLKWVGHFQLEVDDGDDTDNSDGLGWV